MPQWALYYAYAEQYGCHPQDVPQVVTYRAWERWLLLRRAQASREAWSAWRENSKQREDPDTHALRLWAMYKDKR